MEDTDEGQLTIFKAEAMGDQGTEPPRRTGTERPPATREATLREGEKAFSETALGRWIAQQPPKPFVNKKEEEAFCSMGVLADIGLDTYWISEEPYEDIRIGGSLLMLNHSQLVLLGINDTIQRRITCLNDRYRWSFNRIADWIEKHL